MTKRQQSFRVKGFSPRERPMRPKRPEDQAGYDSRFRKVCKLTGRTGYRVLDLPAAGEYDVCLSENQVRTLFPRGVGRHIDSGSTAIVWGRDKRTVVKVTRDPDDVAALQVAQGMKHVVELHKAYALQDAGFDRQSERQVPTYGLVVEQVKRPNRHKLGRWMAGPGEDARDAFMNEAALWRGPRDEFKLSPKLQRALPDACKHYGLDYSHVRGCRRFMTELGETWAELNRRGVAWWDMHDDNIGETAHGTWKVLDLGHSRAAEKVGVGVIRQLDAFENRDGAGSLSGPAQQLPKPRVVRVK